MKNTPPLKIAYILIKLARGGAERFTIDLVTRLDRQQFEPLVVFLKESDPDLQDWQAELERAGVRTITIGKRTKAGIGCFWKLWRLLRAERPVIVHTQLFLADVFGRLSARLAGVPVIISTEQNLNYGEARWRQWCKRLTVPLAHQVVAVSSAVCAYALEHEGVALDQITVIPNGVDSTALPAAGNQLSERKRFMLGAFGRLVPQKGFDVLLEALARLAEQGSSVDCVIAGVGPERQQLEEQARALDLAASVRFIGQPKDTDQFYGSFDLLVMPSRWEGLGIVALEAGARGLPVIASDVDGLRDVITDGEDGLLVSPEDPVALADAISTLRADPQRRAQLAERLRRTVGTRFALADIVTRYQQLYLHHLS